MTSVERRRLSKLQRCVLRLRLDDQQRISLCVVLVLRLDDQQLVYRIVYPVRRRLRNPGSTAGRGFNPAGGAPGARGLTVTAAAEHQTSSPPVGLADNNTTKASNNSTEAYTAGSIITHAQSKAVNKFTSVPQTSELQILQRSPEQHRSKNLLHDKAQNLRDSSTGTTTGSYELNQRYPTLLSQKKALNKHKLLARKPVDVNSRSVDGYISVVNTINWVNGVTVDQPVVGSRTTSRWVMEISR
ncbi:125 kDa kinesin-related protein [Dorcoceras hygrometricum]|uniref:125 kDa kinesin-related protein n=1 Tax=Dorcoceras hygrometricum TaxID=472368 RepID=A0A2Z7BWX0_9LAMI|nr:125 kDa kinesin-related protein [Dorcoceras hygrometricum]